MIPVYFSISESHGINTYPDKKNYEKDMNPWYNLRLIKD
jgi:hypothetical protein